MLAYLLAALALLLQQPQTCTVSGRVVNSLTGDPVRKVKLRLTPQPESASREEANGLSYVETSSADGGFQFIEVPPGSYLLSGDRIGFMETMYGEQKRNQTGTTIALQPGHAVTNIVLRLQPEGVIAGRVVDEDGDALPHVYVQLFRRKWNNGQLTYRADNGNMADDRGEFRFGDLQAGKYLSEAQVLPLRHANEIRSDGKSAVSFGNTFYGDATSVETAAPITIQTGQQVEGIEIHMRATPTFHVRGKLAGALPAGIDSHNMFAVLEPQETHRSVTAFRPIEGDSFDFADVPPGKYRLIAIVEKSHKHEQLTSEPFTVDAADVDGLVLNMQLAHSLHGQVRVSGTPPPAAKSWSTADCSISLVPLSERSFGFDHRAKPKADGTFVVENITPTSYRLDLSGIPDGAYLQSVRLGSEERIHKPLDFSQSTSGELLITFRYGAAGVEAEVETPTSNGGRPALALVADPLPGDGSGIHEGKAGESGTFTFKNLPPGKYELFAFEAIDSGELANAAIRKAIAGKGVTVQLKEGDRKQAQASVIAAADMQQVLKSLGFDIE